MEITSYVDIPDVASNDILPIVDINDTTMGPAGTTKKVTVAQLQSGLVAGVTSVNGLTGAVTLTASSVGADPSGAASTAQSNAEAYALPVAGGTMQGWLAPKVVSITYASTMTPNAALGNDFRVALTGNASIANPANPTDGQDIKFQLTQGGSGGYTITWGGDFDFGTAGAPTLSTAVGKIDVVAGVYNAAKGSWLMGAALGF